MDEIKGVPGLSLDEVEELLLAGGCLREFEELDVALIIVGHPDLLPIILV